MIDTVFKLTNGNILQSAKKLGLSRTGLHKMIKRHGLNPQKYKNQP